MQKKNKSKTNKNMELEQRELLGLKKPEGSFIPEERTQQYYTKRPCAKMIEEAAKIWVEHLKNTTHPNGYLVDIQ